MKRLLVVLLLGTVAATAVVLTMRDGQAPPSYGVELDSAFGLGEGSDVKIAGLPAGQVTALDINRERRAVVRFEISEPGFRTLKSDAFCETRLQSLIGEYFIDCTPGSSRRPLPPGGTIPVERTGSTIPPDLLLAVMRRPYRERLGIIVRELGVGLAGRGSDLNAVIRRANPAARQVNRVLAMLARRNSTLRRLVTDADRLATGLARNRRAVGRFVDEADAAAQAPAARQAELAETVHRLPGFLAELRSTMSALGGAAESNAASLPEVRAAAPELERFMRAVPPVADSARPALRGLAGAADAGRPAVRDARPVVSQLARFARDAPEAGRNMRFFLEDVDDPRRAPEIAPEGRRLTGLEALLRFTQTTGQAVNVFDEQGYLLRASLFLDSECNRYRTSSPEEQAHCRGWLGPSQPGVTTPDPSADAAGARNRARSKDAPAAVGRFASLQELATRGSSPRPDASSPTPAAPPSPNPGPDPAPASAPETLVDFLLAP